MVKKIVLSFIIIIEISEIAFSQNFISGKVIEKFDKQPLIGAVVQIQTSEKVTTTNEQGYFKLEISENSKVLIIKYLGYEERYINLKSNTEDIGKIELIRSNTTLDEILVSASPNNYKSEFKGSNFRINPIALKNINPLSTEEVLRSVPGVNIVGDMGLSNRPNISIRGSWGRRSKRCY